MNIYQIIHYVVMPFRKKRMALFLKIIKPQQPERILDVGGTAYNWELTSCNNEISLLNLSGMNNVNAKLSSNLSHVVGDGTALEYDDNEFDIVFSNSVIEHVGSLEKQRDYANEVCRVGKRIWIQTPAKEFFFEPHYITPFVHWLPKSLQKKLVRNFSLWGLITRPNSEDVEAFVEHIRLLSLEEIRELFPNCTILKERFLFMTKAYLIIKTA